jgi:hypothetical protein
MACGFENDAVLRPLDREHLGHLWSDIARAESAVDDPDAALLRQHDSHGRARDRVHVGRHDGAIERQVFGEPRAQVDRRRVPARHDTELRREQEIVEGRASYQVEQVHRLLIMRFSIWIWPA